MEGLSTLSKSRSRYVSHHQGISQVLTVLVVNIVILYERLVFIRAAKHDFTTRQAFQPTSNGEDLVDFRMML